MSKTTKTTATSKAPKAKKARKAMPNGKSIHASEPVREPHWSPRRIAVVKAMRKLGAVSEETARTAGDIAKTAAKMGAPELADAAETTYHGPYGLYLTRTMLDGYRTAELVHNGFVAAFRPEGSRELSYYLTKKGRETTFPAPERKAESNGKA